jgi:hypothetical protein
MHQYASPRAEEVTARPIERSHWWREVHLILAFYGLYTAVRDLRGTKPVSVEQAFRNARRLIHLERVLGLFHEAQLQRAFLSETWLIRICDDFYGTIHFIAAITVLVVLFLWFPNRYRLWRNTILFATGMALIGFYFFPLMPPRLLPSGYHFVDTLKTVGGLWSFSSGPVEDVSNQYAAMPSLHTAWSTWCALVLFDIVRPWWGRAIALLYPLATIFAIVVTANHYFGDALAGLALVAVSYLLARTVTTYLDRLYAQRTALAENFQERSPESRDGLVTQVRTGAPSAGPGSGNATR